MARDLVSEGYRHAAEGLVWGPGSTEEPSNDFTTTVVWRRYVKVSYGVVQGFITLRTPCREY